MSGNDLQQGAKHAAQKNSIQFDANRSFLKIDKSTIPQSENTRHFEIDTDSNTNQNVVATSDPTLFMITSPESPPIGNEHRAEQQSFISHRSTPKIEKSLNKIKATKADETQNTILQKQYSWTIKHQKQRQAQKTITKTLKQLNENEREYNSNKPQANIMSIIPADRNTNIQLEQSTNEPIQQQHDSPSNNPTTLNSLKSSTSSQEYRTPPVSQDLVDISDLNSENLKELDEKL